MDYIKCKMNYLRRRCRPVWMMNCIVCDWLFSRNFSFFEGNKRMSSRTARCITRFKSFNIDKGLQLWREKALSVDEEHRLSQYWFGKLKNWKNMPFLPSLPHCSILIHGLMITQISFKSLVIWGFFFLLIFVIDYQRCEIWVVRYEPS